MQMHPELINPSAGFEMNSSFKATDKSRAGTRAGCSGPAAPLWGSTLMNEEGGGREWQVINARVKSGSGVSPREDGLL